MGDQGLRAAWEGLLEEWRHAGNDVYYCGSNYCDDPICVQEHAELL